MLRFTRFKQPLLDCFAIARNDGMEGSAVSAAIPPSVIARSEGCNLQRRSNPAL